MRLKIKFTPNNEPVNNSVEKLLSWLFNSLGRNNVFHGQNDKKSYSVSNMLGGYKNADGTYNYPSGGCVFVSSSDPSFLSAINKGAWNNDFGFGMSVLNIEPTMDEIHLTTDYNYFNTTNEGIILYEESDFGSMTRNVVVLLNERWEELLLKQTKRKLRAIDDKVRLTDLKIELVRDNNMFLKENVIKDYTYKSSVCTLKITGSVDAKRMIMTYGLGNLCSSGFGCMYPTEMFSEYVKKNAQ